ncbi:hypothetical protein [Streptomyces sp. NPDC001508]|uniref:hypothetical protein n=1 Tax=Streptomyces sp. NPDC001508 TaxID=3154656 RepID=UPI003325E952
MVVDDLGAPAVPAVFAGFDVVVPQVLGDGQQLGGAAAEALHLVDGVRAEGGGSVSDADAPGSARGIPG